jgi:hypothetical protein
VERDCFFRPVRIARKKHSPQRTTEDPR